MKSKMNIKSIIVVFILSIMISMFFINMSFAVNTAKVKVETANLRKTASEEDTILEQISINEEVEILEKLEGWYKVKYNSIEGYLREDLIEVQGEETPEVQETQENNTEQNTTTTTNSEENADTQVQQVESGKRIITENTKLKIVPVINATDLIEVQKDEEVEVIEVVNGWACIKVQNTKGWIRQEKLQEEKQTENDTNVSVPASTTVEEKVIKTQYIASSTVNVRSQPTTNSNVVTQLSVNQKVEIYSETNGWSKIKVNGKEGYVLSSLLSDNMQETSRSSDSLRKNNTTQNNAVATTTKAATTTATTSTASVSNNNNTSSNAKTTEQNNTAVTTNSSKGAEIVAYAKQFIGIKYKYGGTSPSTGFDCSGFTQYVYKHFGISIPRTTGGQSTVGKAVSKSELQPGDLVIYSGHVAIYVGGGQVIHSPRTGKTICIVSLNNAKPGCYKGARRLI